MSGGQHIRAVGQEAAQNAPVSDQDAGAAAIDDELDRAAAEQLFETELDLGEYDVEGEYIPETQRFGWVLPALAGTIITAWTALYAWAMRAELMNAAGAAPSEWTRWIIDWSVPVLLVCVIWILTMRHSRAEARRFAETAASLSQESRELEDRLTVVNRELSLAREFLGAQSRDLESLGRVASERLSTHAGELQQLIKNNGAQVDAIGSASETALANMKRLRDDLPVVANSARDVSNQVGNAGRTAQEQVQKLISGFERLNQFGTASENQVNTLSTRITEALGGFEAQVGRIEEFTSNRFGALKEQAADYRNEIAETESAALGALNERVTLLQAETKAIAVKLREAEAEAMNQLAASKERFRVDFVETIDGLTKLDMEATQASQKRVMQLNQDAANFDAALAKRDEQFMAELKSRQDQFAAREAEATEELGRRLASLDNELEARREAQSEKTAQLITQSQAMGKELEDLNALIATIGEASETTKSSLSDGIGSLEEQLATKRQGLMETEAQLKELTEAAIRLLEIIQSGAKHSREDLPAAIKAASDTLGAVEGRAAELGSVMLNARSNADDLSNYLIETHAKIEDADSSIHALNERLKEQSEEALARIQGLRTGFAQLTQDSTTLAGSTQESLLAALAQLEDATQSAFEALESGAREKVSALAESIASEASETLEKSLQGQTDRTAGTLERATKQAADSSRAAAMQLRDQLAKVNELTGNLEQRVARAREQAEEQVSNDFARRMALITDSLNSSAIDITNALTTDVSDTAWDDYLKGDRGIFTRRAVRLIDAGEARDIATLYQNDDTFRSNVNRYIHDFEAMLRAMLSTRDGNALGVTILGSDIGKLYVVLAQAIERFRS